MNTQQIQCAIDCDPIMKQKVIGVFARDEIPRTANFPFGIVMNTDPKTSEGTHWLALYYQSKNTIELFDSYGHSPEYFGLKASAYNNKRLQSKTSDVCGQYCLYYLLNKCRGVSMNSIVKPFSDNYAENDSFVNDFVSKAFPYCFNFTCKYQSCKAEINLLFN